MDTNQYFTNLFNAADESDDSYQCPSIPDDEDGLDTALLEQIKLEILSITEGLNASSALLRSVKASTEHILHMLDEVQNIRRSV